MELVHNPLLDHIENADLDAVRAFDAHTFDAPALDEFGSPRLPLVRAIELSVLMLGCEDEARARLAIAADMVRRYGPDRAFCPFVVLDGDDDEDASEEEREEEPNNSDYYRHLAPRLRWPAARAAMRVTPLSLALLQVNLYPEDLGATPTTAAEAKNDEEDASGSDVPLVRRLLRTLMVDAGASPAADGSLFGSLVGLGLHELLPWLVGQGAAPDAPASAGCLHTLLRNSTLPPGRIVATLDALLRLLLAAPALPPPPLLLRPEDGDARGRTPLHRAATLQRSCAAAVAARLLCLGACPFARDAEGCTPLALARAHTDEQRLALACCRCSPPINQRAAWRARRAFRHASTAEAVLVAAEAQAAAELALLMGLHPRLGADAPLLRALDPAIVRALIVVAPWREDVHAALCRSTSPPMRRRPCDAVPPAAC